jgi:PAS domain S-box-containing protein
MVGKTVGELSPFKDLVSNQAMLERLQKHGYVRYHDLPLETQAGRKVDVEFVSNLYQVGDQKVIQCNIREITDRKRAEEALRVSQQMVGEIINVMPVSVFWKDKNLVYLGCNLTFAKDAGFADPKDIIGKDDRQMVWREQAEAFRSDDREVIMSGKSKLLIEESKTTPEGKTITVLASKIPLCDAKGEIIGMIGTYLDITARKRVQESQTRLAMAVEQATETVVITDTEGKIFYANPAFEKTSGYTRAEVLGQNPRILKSGKQDDDFYVRMWESLRRGETWSGHFINRRKDGTLYEEEATISPVRDTTGKVVNYVAVKRDVTKEVQLESQLRQSQKMEAFGQLAGGVAHDFNNILAVVQLQAGLLKSNQGLSLEQLDFAREIEKSAQRGADLTRQLLLFSRKQILQPRNLNLKDLVDNMAKMLRRTLGEQVELQLKFAQAPLFVHADPGMLDQILLNLTVNARDAMPKGGKIIVETSAVEFDEVTATQSPQARPGSFVCLSVSDTGCGIPPEILPRIFEPFFTTKGVGQGTGLGLATVFGIVQQHHGWISVYSEVNRGTTFQVYLPRQTKTSDTEFFWSSPAAIRGGNETILLVEDELPVRAAMRIALSRMGYLVLEAATGDAALTVWKEHRDEIRLLLTDLVMPGGMNGKALAARLLQANPKLKVIYASGYNVKVAGQDLRLEDGVNFLAKPFQTDKLAQTIRKRLDQN